MSEDTEDSTRFHWQRVGLFGGHMALEFVNTVDDDGKTRDRDAIPDWSAALEWAVLAGVIEEDEVEGLRSDPGAETVLRDLVAFREPAWRLLSAIAAEREPDPADIAVVSAGIAWAQGVARLRIDGRTARWEADSSDAGADVLRARLALATGALLTSPDLARLRECGRCTGLYLDHGRGKGRRWCRMETCGNRAKVERFRAKG